MNTKVWYLSYFEGVYHARMIETYLNVNARIVHLVHTMVMSLFYQCNLHHPMDKYYFLSLFEEIYCQWFCSFP